MPYCSFYPIRFELVDCNEPPVLIFDVIPLRRNVPELEPWQPVRQVPEGDVPVGVAEDLVRGMPAEYVHGKRRRGRGWRVHQPVRSERGEDALPQACPVLLPQGAERVCLRLHAWVWGQRHLLQRCLIIIFIFSNERLSSSDTLIFEFLPLSCRQMRRLLRQRRQVREERRRRTTMQMYSQLHWAKVQGTIRVCLLCWRHRSGRLAHLLPRSPHLHDLGPNFEEEGMVYSYQMIVSKNVCH